MNQVFNLKRFLNFARCQFLMNRKTYAYTLGGFSIILLLVEVLIILTNNRYWNEHNWTAMFLITIAIAGLLIIGHSFPFLRKKANTHQYLVMPASVVEKFVHEFLFKLVLFITLFFLLFPFISDLALNIVYFIGVKKTLVSFSYRQLFIEETEIVKLVTSIFLLAFSLAFAGSAAIRRYPLIKVILIIGGLFLTCVGYFYLIFEHWNLDRGVEYVMRNIMKDEIVALNVALSIIGFTVLMSWTYAFFKLKEREV